MIKQLKSNIVLVYALSILLVTTASIEVFYNSGVNRFNFFNWYTGFISRLENSSVLDYILTVLVVLFTGYFINRAFNKTSFYNKTTGFPIFIFVLIVSTIGGFYFDTHFIIDFLFSLVFLRIIDIDQNKSAIHVSFLSGLLFGISYLFSYWMIPAGLVVFYSLLTFRPFQWREWLVGLLGMGLPLLYLLSIRYLYLDNYTVLPKTIQVSSGQNYWYDYLSYALLIIIVLVALIALSRQLKFQSNIERKQINILAFFTVVTLLISAGIYWVYDVNYIVFTVPLTLLVSLPIVNVKRDKFLNLIVISLVVINLLRIFVF